jgi:hypothetical protein
MLPAKSFANAFELTFVGTWSHWDPYDHSQQFWDAMTAVGVVPGAPVIYTIVVQDLDRDSRPNSSSYGVVAGTLTVGNLTLTSEATQLVVQNSQAGSTSIDFTGSWKPNPTVGPFSPSYQQMFITGPSEWFSDDPGVLFSNVLTGVALRRNLLIGFSSADCGLCMGVTLPALRSVQAIPEAATLWAGVSGAFILCGWHRIRRRRP